MHTLDVIFEPISQPILDPDNPSYALSPKSHDDSRNLLRQLKYRNHEDRKDDQEEQRQWLECIKNWLECIKNSYAIVRKECLDEVGSLWVESKPDLDPKGELKSISLINMTHLSLEETLDKINPRVTNPWKILDNK